MRTDSPDLVIAMRLLDHAKLRGFEFRRGAPGEDGPVVGHRVAGDWVDAIHIEGFSRDCFAWRKRISPLIVPGNGLIERQVGGSALKVPRGLLRAPRFRRRWATPGQRGPSTPVDPPGNGP